MTKIYPGGIPGITGGVAGIMGGTPGIIGGIPEASKKIVLISKHMFLPLHYVHRGNTSQWPELWPKTLGPVYWLALENVKEILKSQKKFHCLEISVFYSMLTVKK